MTSFVSACVFVLSCVAVCAREQPGLAVSEVRDLAPGHPVSVLLTAGHAATLRLEVSGSSANEILLDTTVPGIWYRIATGDGTEIRSGRLATFGWAAIPMVIPPTSTGWLQVQIQLKAENGVEGLPSVRVRTELRPIQLNSLEAHEDATRRFNAAQLSHRSLHGEDVRRAIMQFEQAAQQWERAGFPYGQALALGGKGESEVELSRYADAQRTLDRALFLAGDNAYLRGWLLHLQARVLFDQYEGKQAREITEEEMRLGQRIADPALIALARADMIGVAFWLHDAKMDQIADQAHSEAIAAGVPDTLALELRWKGGWVDEYFQRDVSAINALNESDRFFRQAGDWRSILENTLDEAQAINQNGDIYSALVSFVKFDPVVRDSGSDTDYADNLVDIGDQYHQLNSPRLAELFYRRAYAVYAGAHLLFGQMVTQIELCEAELATSGSAKAEPECQLALRIARKFGDTAYLGEAQCDLGIAEHKAGSLTRAFVDLNEAVKLTHTVNDPLYESKEHIQLGELLEQSGKHSNALAEFQQAESLSQSVADPASLLEAQYVVARWYAWDRQFAKAEVELAPALERLETARQLVSSSTLQASYFAAERKCYELAVELRMREFERDPAGGGDALALDLSERSRARSLLDALHSQSTSQERERNDDEAGLVRSNIEVDRAFNRRLKLLVEGGMKRDLDSSAADLTLALSDLERAQDRMHADARDAPKPAPTMSTGEIEKASLSSGDTFFEYALGSEHSYLWVIAGGKRKSYVLPSRERLEGMVKRWRTYASSPEHLEANADAKFQLLSAQLSCALLGNAVEAHMTRMVIVPDGNLVTLPFAALAENACSNTPGDPLVVEHEVILAPSLSVLLSHKPPAEHRAFEGEVAIVADPVFDRADPRAARLKSGELTGGPRPAATEENPIALPRLLNAGYEASAIQETVRNAEGNDKVFLAQGFDASVETVLSPVMQNYRIWHLATHGFFDAAVPEFSGLIFSTLGLDGSSRSGFLKAHEISSLRVRAELVVLSACDSATGHNLSGEGMMGLSYSFLHAGAKQIVSTLWSVDDSKSKELMIAFYTELMQNGGNVAAALRKGQLAVMRQPHGSAPYYWAGYELTSLGD